jgi:hypothetical protein
MAPSSHAIGTKVTEETEREGRYVIRSTGYQVCEKTFFAGFRSIPILGIGSTNTLLKPKILRLGLTQTSILFFSLPAFCFEHIISHVI